MTLMQPDGPGQSVSHLLLLIPFWGCVGCWSLSQLTLGESGVNPSHGQGTTLKDLCAKICDHLVFLLCATSVKTVRGLNRKSFHNIVSLSTGDSSTPNLGDI